VFLAENAAQRDNELTHAPTDSSKHGCVGGQTPPTPLGKSADWHLLGKTRALEQRN
jgi:hypothetical protein